MRRIIPQRPLLKEIVGARECARPHTLAPLRLRLNLLIFEELTAEQECEALLRLTISGQPRNPQPSAVRYVICDNRAKAPRHRQWAQPEKSRGSWSEALEMMRRQGDIMECRSPRPQARKSRWPSASAIRD